MSIQDAWTRLHTGPDQPASGVLAVRLCPQSKHNLFAAVDPHSDRRFLILKSNIPPASPLQELPEGLGFALRYLETPGEPDGLYSLRFELANPSYADVFDVIANDILENVVACGDLGAGFNVFAGRIAEWQTFLNSLPRTGLSEQHQQGLFAELSFLRDVLLQTCSAAKAVAAWAGPKALSKDFQFNETAFEVKATTTKQPTRFRISNEIQLEFAPNKRLFVCGCVLERVLAGGTSLPQVVQSVRQLLEANSAVLARFAHLLFQSGYADFDSERYDAQFNIRAVHFFEVKDDFPRMVGTDLRLGVIDVNYSILLSECLRFEVAETEIRALLAALDS
jgi:hypothetical protein